MKHTTFRKSLLALMVAASFPASAASYYVVVPVPAKKVSNSAITVSLSAYTAPVGQVGIAYSGFDLRAALSVTGDPGYTGYGVKWQVLDGSLPAGLTLNSNGTVTGTPTAAGASNFTVRASYKTKNGDQQYQIVTYRIDVGLAAGTPPQAFAGQAYTYDLNSQLTVTGDPAFNGAGVSWSVVSSSLPAGLYLTSGGVISGTPTASGGGSITARATYKGMNGQQTYQVVSLNISVALATGTPPQALVGQAYAYNLNSLLAVSGDPGFTNSSVTWSVVSNSLPAGLYLTADGYIGGTPTASGSGAITARATYKNVKGDQTYQVVSLNITVALAAGTPPQALVGQAYAYNLNPLLSVSGDPSYNGTGVTWTVVSSSLPAGLYLTADGYIGGTPTASGNGSITARAAYKNGKGEQTYQVVALDVTVALAAGTPPQAQVGQAYAYNLNPLLSVSGDPGYNGTGVTWAAISGTLPAGLTLGADGFIKGTPTAAGTGTVTVRATYKNGKGDQTYQVVSLNITVALAAGAPPQALVGQAYTYNLNPLLSVSGDPGFTGSGVTWAVASGSLPAGLTLTSDGRISGTPAAAGTGSVTVRATYRNVVGQQAYQVVALNIVVSLANATMPVAVTGNNYGGYDFKGFLSVTGDSAYTVGSETWSLVSGNIPSGMTFGSNGVLSGTPAVAGTANFTLQATYRGQTAQHAYALQVDQAQVPGALSADSGTDFGVFGLGGAATRTFTFVNNGNTAATGLYASASGTGYALWASTCGSPGAPITLAKGASCNFTARFSPSSPGVLNGTVAVNWSGPSASGKSLPVTGATTVDYSWLMGGWTNNTVAIGRNPAWAAGLQWFWYASGAENSANVGQYEYRRTVYVAGTSPVSAYLYGATDNQLDAVYVNGALALGYQGMPFDAWRGSGWFTLQPGTNVISIVVENAGASANPAGFALEVIRSDGAALTNEWGWMWHP